MSGIDIETEIIEKPLDPEPDKKKVRNSVFFITINSNKSMTNGDPTTLRRFEDYLRTVFSNTHITKYIEDKNHEGALSGEYVFSVRSQMSFERGQKLDRFHAHALVQVKHDTSVAFRIRLLKEMLRRVTGQNCYVNVQVYSNAAFNLANYIRK